MRARTLWLGAALALASCGGKTPPARLVPPSDVSDPAAAAAPAADAGPTVAGPSRWPAPPAGFAMAAFVALDGGDLVTFALEGGKPVELGRATLAKVDPDDYFAALSGDFADHDHLIVLIPPRTVVLVTAEAITELPVPGPERFTTPRPPSQDEGLTEGGVMADSSSRTGLIVQAGEAWWAECPWGYPYDGWQCETWVAERLWPEPERMENEGPVYKREYAWPKVVPTGYKTEYVGDTIHVLGCTAPKAKRQTFRGTGEDDVIMDHFWVSADPARLLLIYGSMGLDDFVAERWSLHEGCAKKVIAQGTYAEPGPGGLWLAWETDQPEAEEPKPNLRLWKGAERVAPLDDVGAVILRP